MWLTLAMTAGLLAVPDSDDAVATPLSWQAPAQCPDASAVMARIARLMGRMPSRGELRVSGLVTQVDRGFSLALHIEAGALVDDRVLVAERCEVLADTMALVTAVVVDPIAAAVVIDVPGLVAVAAADDAAADPLGVPVAAGSGRAPSRVRVRESTPTPERPRSSEPLGVWGRARAGGQLGAVPGFTGGVELAIALGTRRWRGEVVGAYWFARTLDSGEVSLRVQLGTVTPRVCATVPQRRLDVIACVGPELGVMRGDVAGGPTRQPFWLALAAEAGMRLRVSPRVSLWATIGAAAPLVFPRFRLVAASGAQQRDVYRPASAGARMGVGVEVRLRGRESFAPVGRRKSK